MTITTVPALRLGNDDRLLTYDGHGAYVLEVDGVATHYSWKEMDEVYGLTINDVSSLFPEGLTGF